MKRNNDVDGRLEIHRKAPNATITEEYINPSFAVVLLSGPSGSGKSTLVNLICKKNCRKHQSVSVLRKFTTRPQRREEFDEFNFCTPDEFKDNNKIAFPYPRFGYLYGFSREHLFELAKSETLMFCISPDLRTTRNLKHFLKTKDIDVTSILLQARPQDLENRIRLRHPPQKDLKIRKR